MNLFGFLFDQAVAKWIIIPSKKHQSYIRYSKEVSRFYNDLLYCEFQTSSNPNYYYMWYSDEVSMFCLPRANIANKIYLLNVTFDFYLSEDFYDHNIFVLAFESSCQ